MATHEAFTGNDLKIDKKAEKEDKVYSYEEAITLAGTGRYTHGLLAVVSLSVVAMACDMFGFSVVVVGSQCDLQLTPIQRNVLLSMPFLGPVVMSYPWGYFSDTRGRRKCLLLAMSCGFLASIVSVFSPNWIMLAVLRFVSTSCCSCAQSATYALLGESSSQRVRGSYMLAMTSVLMLSPTCYFVTGYFVLNLEFSLDLGFISFMPWRLLALVMALPMGMSWLALLSFYESPKFLANAGREDEAVELLEKIWRRNGGMDEYPVKKLILNEDSTAAAHKLPFLRSLWAHTAPLFHPPLLWRTLQLYYITAMLYAVNNSLLMWYPFLLNVFLTDDGSADQGGLCNMILRSQDASHVQQASVCLSKLDYFTTLFSIVHSLSFALINIFMSCFAGRMKLMLLTILTVAFTSGVVIIMTTNNTISFLFFIGIMTTGLGIGVVFSYFIELYPTSYRGMAACLAVIMARGSALTAINILGSNIMTNCHQCFYAYTAYILSGLIASCFLPSDAKKKT
ncbi:synaptic vesicle glycoprotein 2C-like [Cydia pomonella]|uniref:synaptic vesicle glycoprotein 2C-like n=1 Tax=Cydia pomonella TaxID=82600 RepID=UPI002ADE742A|nr:synaptic vesicle glycoprotein 2C-like [Cydia pomonella]